MAHRAQIARRRGEAPALPATVWAMSLFADPGELYAIADRIASHADAVRAAASRLAAAIADDHWHGVASEVFSAQAGGVLKDMWACARRLDDAADALRRHASRVQGVLSQFALLWHGLESVGETAAHDVGDLLVRGGAVVDGAFADLIAQVAR